MKTRYALSHDKKYYNAQKGTWVSLKHATLFSSQKAAQREKVGVMVPVYVTDSRNKLQPKIVTKPIFRVSNRCDVLNQQEHKYFYSQDDAETYAQECIEKSVHSILGKFVEIRNHGVNNILSWFENKLNDRILIERIEIQ